MRFNTLSKLAMAFFVAATVSVASARTKKLPKKAKAKAHHAQVYKPSRKSAGHKAASEYMKAGKSKRKVASVKHKNSKREIASAKQKNKKRQIASTKHKKSAKKKKSSRRSRY